MIGLGRIRLRISVLLVIMEVFFLLHHNEAEAQVISEDRFNALLSGMGSISGEPNFDNVLAGMNSPRIKPEADMNAILSGMESSNNKGGNLDALLSAMMEDKIEVSGEFDGVLSSMRVASALNYLDNAFSGSNSHVNYGLGYYGDINGYSGNIYPHIGGKAVIPVRGRITSRFGFRPAYGRMHKGIDIALQVGDTIVAAMDGKVERVSIDPHGYGIFVCLDHSNGVKTRYAHLCRSLVTPGMFVTAGEAIALGGNTGNSTGPHLHFETRVNDTAMDPSKFFDFSMPVNVGKFSTLARFDEENAKMGMNPVNSHGFVSQGYYNESSKGTYVVKIGDTIASVAKKNGISVMSL